MEVDEMKSKFKKLMAAALVLCLMLALLPAGVLADGDLGITVTYKDFKQNVTDYGSTGSVIIEKTEGNSDRS